MIFTELDFHSIGIKDEATDVGNCGQNTFLLQSRWTTTIQNKRIDLLILRVHGMWTKFFAQVSICFVSWSTKIAKQIAWIPSSILCTVKILCTVNGKRLVLPRSRWSTTTMAKLEWLEENRMWIDFTISYINVNLNVNICSLNVNGYICNVNIWMQTEDAFYSSKCKCKCKCKFKCKYLDADRRCFL